MKYLFFTIVLAGLSCSKQENNYVPSSEPLPTFVQVEAVHEDGTLLSSKIILVR